MPVTIIRNHLTHSKENSTTIEKRSIITKDGSILLQQFENYCWNYYIRGCVTHYIGMK